MIKTATKEMFGAEDVTPMDPKAKQLVEAHDKLSKRAFEFETKKASIPTTYPGNRANFYAEEEEAYNRAGDDFMRAIQFALTDDAITIEETEEFKHAMTALEQIASLWPENTTASIMDVVGVNDGKSRAILLDSAITIARNARTTVRQIVNRMAARRARWQDATTMDEAVGALDSSL